MHVTSLKNGRNLQQARLVSLVLVVFVVSACSQSQDLTAPSISASTSPLAALGPAPKVDVCHKDGQGGVQRITVSSNAYDMPVGTISGVPSGSTFSASSTWDAVGYRTPSLQSPSFAFDGDTQSEWNAGAWPTAWIQVDFGSPQVITGMTALTDQSPSYTNHDVTFDGVAAFSWSGFTSNGQTLTQTFAIPQTVQVVRITTNSGVSWVAWPEISFQRMSC